MTTTGVLDRLMTNVNADMEAARMRKATRLAAWLARAGATQDLSIDLIDWTAATELAGVNPPSDETKRLTMTLLPKGK